MSGLRRIGPLGIASMLALGVAVVAVAAPGDLDPSFGNGGRVVVAPYVEAVGSSAALQPDGKILLAGWADDIEPPPPPPLAPNGLRASNADFLAVRLTPNGGLDPTFGSGGVVRTPIDLGNGNGDSAWAVAPGPGGTVILAGNALTANSALDFAFVRYTSSGALDATFSGDGIQTVDGGSFDYVRGVAVQPDGKIVAVGRGSGQGFTVLRLLANGALDGTFGTGGIVNTVIGDPSIEDEATAVLLIDGRIVVAGVAEWQNPGRTAFAVVRYLSNGELDPSFGAGGISVGRGSYDQRAWAVAAAPGGKIVVAGATGGDFRVARYLATGALDGTFGGEGFVSTSFERFYAMARGVAVQADGKVVAGGLALTSAPDSDRFAVARYNLDGTRDTSFGVNGQQTYDIATRVWGGAGVLQAGAAPGGGDRFVVAGQGSAGAGMADHVVAVGLDLGAPGPPPPGETRCMVPRVIRLRLAVARSKIRLAHCRVGRIRRVRARRFKGKVVAQSPRAGRRLRSGARVNLVVGRR